MTLEISTTKLALARSCVQTPLKESGGFSLGKLRVGLFNVVPLAARRLILAFRSHSSVLPKPSDGVRITSIETKRSLEEYAGGEDEDEYEDYEE